MAGVMSKPRRSPPRGQKRPCLSLAGYQHPVFSPPPRLIGVAMGDGGEAMKAGPR